MRVWNFLRARKALRDAPIAAPREVPDVVPGLGPTRAALVKGIPSPAIRLAVEMKLEVLDCKVSDTRASAPDDGLVASGELPMGLGSLMPVGLGALALEVTYRVVVSAFHIVEERPANVEFLLAPGDGED